MVNKTLDVKVEFMLGIYLVTSPLFHDEENLNSSNFPSEGGTSSPSSSWGESIQWQRWPHKATLPAPQFNQGLEIQDYLSSSHQGKEPPCWHTHGPSSTRATTERNRGKIVLWKSSPEWKSTYFTPNSYLLNPRQSWLENWHLFWVLLLSW